MKWKKNVRRETTLFPAFSVTKSFGQMDEVLEIPFSFMNIRYVQWQWWYNAQEYQELEQLLRETCERDIHYVMRIVAKQHQMGEKLKHYVREIAGKEFSAAELSPELQRYLQNMTDFYTFWWIAIPTGDLLEAKVRDILSRENVGIDVKDLVFSPRELELTREHKELLKIGIAVQGKPFSDLSPDLRQQLEDHAQRFGWISCSYHIGTPLTSKDFFDKIYANPQVALSALHAEEERQRKVMTELQKKLSPSEMKIIQAMQEIIFLRNYQKETVNECQHKSEPFLHQIAQQLHWLWEDFLALTSNEVISALKGGSLPSAQDIAERKEFAIILENKRCFLAEPKAYGISNQDDVDYTPSLIIKGTSACPGLVEGKVRVILNKQQLGSFQKGEVLVTAMTTIDYIQAMRQAAAIVTDEGGITCHAAIFSREIGVPCIIGTGNGTKILQNGDRVEVNAVKGMVKKL